MRYGFVGQMLIAICLTTMLPYAMAIQEPLIGAPGSDVVLPGQSEPKPVPATGSRGQLLYENHCQQCHTSVVHVRETRRARSLKELEHWVTRWSGELNLSWGAEEISEVVDYLNRRYYKFDIPSRQP